MKFLPKENITYETKLSEEEIIKRLADVIEPEKMFRGGIFGNKSTKPYEGKIDADEFNIKRIISYRNSFLPRINGVIETHYDGTTIRVKMRVHTVVQVFLYFCMGNVGLGCIELITKFFSDPVFTPASFIPSGMMLFVYVLAMGSFKYESNKSKKDLQSVFEAEMIQ